LADAKTRTDFFLRTLEDGGSTQTFVISIDCILNPRLVPGRTLALTNRRAPNFRIVELRTSGSRETEWVEIIPQCDARISQWRIAEDRILVSYVRQGQYQVSVFDMSGNSMGKLPVAKDETVRFIGSSTASNELLFEKESFTQPISIWRYSPATGEQTLGPRKLFHSTPRNMRMSRCVTPRKMEPASP